MMTGEDLIQYVMDRFETYHNELVRFPTIHGGDYFVAAAVLAATEVLLDNSQDIVRELRNIEKIEGVAYRLRELVEK